MPSIDTQLPLRDGYQRNGFALVPVLEPHEVLGLRARIETLLGRAAGRASARAGFCSSSFQHHGDRLEDYGKVAKHYYFHLITDPRSLPVHHAFHLPCVLSAAESLLGPDLIINNASLLAAEPGTTYRLGCHRDVIQIPEAEIVPEAIYSPSWFHNNVQINLPLYPDDALWVVPGSHLRPNTIPEEQAFAGSRHYAPLAAEMPGGVNVQVPPGHAVLYNNNLIHRGHHPQLPGPRLTLHLGYHSRRRPPTWHFYLLDESRFSASYRAQMSDRMREMLDAYFACRAEHPRMQDTWPRRA
jgi:hypothetical protein